MSIIFFHPCDIPPDEWKKHESFNTSKIFRYFLLHVDHLQITLDMIVIKMNDSHHFNPVYPALIIHRIPAELIHRQQMQPFQRHTDMNS